METSAQHAAPSHETALGSPETAPLLASASGEGSRQYDATTTEPQPEVADTPETSRQSSARNLYVSFLVLLIIDIAIFVFGTAKYSLGRYGGRQFGFYDYSTSDDGAILLGTSVSLFFTIANIARLRRAGRPAAPLINVIAYGVCAVLFCSVALSAISYRIEVGISDCDQNLDSPDKWYDGSLEECNEWRPKYVAVSWVYIILTLLHGLIAAVLTIVTIVLVYRNTPERENGRVANWTLPSGQLSIEVSLRWGPPSSQRTSTTEQS